MKICPNCRTKCKPESKFCPECGTKFNGQTNSISEGSGFYMGDKNVIAGDIIGHKEETHIAGNATIIKNEDQTKQVKRCHICGSLIQIVDGFDCPECGLFTCSSCYDESEGCCTECAKTKSEQKINKYKEALKMVLADGRIEQSERIQLNNLQRELGISSEIAAKLENELKNTGSVKNELTTVEKLNIEQAQKLYYNESNTAAALQILEPIYQSHKIDEQILSLYLPVLAETKPQDALQIIDSLQFDVLSAYITAVDIAIKTKALDEAERKLNKALRIWPDNALVKCYQVLLRYALYQKFNQQSFLDEAVKFSENLGEAQNELELSMQVRISLLIQEATSATVPEITKEFCEENHLYWNVMNSNPMALKVSQEEIISPNDTEEKTMPENNSVETIIDEVKRKEKLQELHNVLLNILQKVTTNTEL